MVWCVLRTSSRVVFSVWLTTPQPRNFEDAAQRTALADLKVEMTTRYPSRLIDFYTDLADADGRIRAEFDSGDGIHLNADAHRLLFERVVTAMGAEPR